MTPTVFSPAPASAPPPQARVRPARRADVGALHNLIQFYADHGILLPRRENEFREIIGDFRVISSQGRLLAYAVLDFYTPQARNCAP